MNGAKAEGDILIAIDTGTGAFAAGDIVTFDGDSNKYLVAAATATAITTAARLTSGTGRQHRYYRWWRLYRKHGV